VWVAPGGSVWKQTSTAVFDVYGRGTDITDVRGNHETTVYTPSTGGPVTKVETTTALGTTTTTVEPSWGTKTAVVDHNGKRTEGTLDALGRTRQVWSANRLKSAYPTSPNITYDYTVRNSGGVNAITTTTLNAATATNPQYTTSYQLYDGLMRSRQTQVKSLATGNVGTVFTETKYDDKGRVASESKHYDNLVQPGTTLSTIADWQPKTQTVSVYDRAGRVTATVAKSVGSELYRTTNVYGGDRVNVVEPTGRASTTVIDGRGRTVELRKYHNAANVGSNTRSTYDLTQYHFDRKGNQDSVTDNAGNAWTYTFDLLGHQTKVHDPDKGDVFSTYNTYGELSTVKDDRNVTTAYEYDTLGRKIGLYNGSVAPANKLATWAWDPLGFKGQLGSTSRWLPSGEEYKVKVRAYTAMYQPTGEDYIVPASLAGGTVTTHTVSRTYRVDGSPATVTYPPGGGLSAETITYTYDNATGLPEQLQTNNGQGTYVNNTDYTEYGETTFVEYKQASGNFVQRSFAYDDIDRRLKDAVTIRQLAPQAVDDTHYTYDKDGSVIGKASGADKQCFAYDYAARLSDAWTPSNGDCNPATRSASTLGGPAPYWQSWTFDAAGSRKTETAHTAAGNTTTTYNYPAAGSAKPHAVSSITTGSTTLNYQYDNLGNTTCRPVSTGANSCPTGTSSQSLGWDAEGRLATVNGSSGLNTYTYAANGMRLAAEDPVNTTLYLPSMEIRRVKSNGTTTANRYYDWAGQTFAMSATGGAVTWFIGDNQNTQQVAVTANTQAVTVRRQNPYGAPRGGSPAWPNGKGFISGERDATGLTHIGAREYDPAAGRFISVDPAFVATDPASMNGYGYANNTPVSSADPSGMRPDNECTGSCLKNWAQANAEERPKLREFWDTVYDVRKPCNKQCALARNKLYQDTLKLAGPKKKVSCGNYKCDYDNLPKGYTEVVVDENALPVMILEGIALTTPQSYSSQDVEAARVDISKTTGWGKEMSGSAEVSLAGTVGGGGLSYTYTLSQTESESLTIGADVKVPQGYQLYMAPRVEVTWQKVELTRKGPKGERLVVGTAVRMKVRFVGNDVTVAPGGKAPALGWTNKNVPNAILNDDELGKH
jgi:RHS repeat-associated protein